MPDTESASTLRAALIEFATKGPSLGVISLATSDSATNPRHVSVEYMKAFRDLITASTGRQELTRLIIAANPLSIEILTCYVLETQISARLQERLVHDPADGDNGHLRTPISELFGRTDSQRAMNITCTLEANGITTIGELVRKSGGDYPATAPADY